MNSIRIWSAQKGGTILLEPQRTLSALTPHDLPGKSRSGQVEKTQMTLCSLWLDPVLAELILLQALR